MGRGQLEAYVTGFTNAEAPGDQGRQTGPSCSGSSRAIAAQGLDPANQGAGQQ